MCTELSNGDPKSIVMFIICEDRRFLKINDCMKHIDRESGINSQLDYTAK